MTRYYFYKLVADNGGAPCVFRNVLSLAICKSKIRSSCRIGDWIFGFGARSTIGEKLVYIAEITEKLTSGEYYRLDKYNSRPDCIYTWKGDNLVWRKGSRYHVNGHQRDIGIYPGFNRANVLLSNNYRYFGQEGTEDYKLKYPALAKAINYLKQGHRVNHSKQLLDQLQSLREDMWTTYKIKKIGKPNDLDTQDQCWRTEGNIEVTCIC